MSGLRDKPGFRAAAWMLLAVAAYLVAVASIRTLSGYLDPNQTALARNLFGLAACLAIAARTDGIRAALRRSPLGEHALRAIIHAAGGLALIWSVANLPLALVSAMEFTGPVFGLLIGLFLLREPIRPNAVRASGFVIAGIATIALLTKNPIGPLMAIPIAATALLTLATLQMKRMAKDQPIVLILLFMNLFQIPIYFASGTVAGWRSVSPDGWPVIAAAVTFLGISGLATQTCLAKASRLASAATITTLDTLRIPAVMSLGYLGYGESVDAGLAFGAAMIAIGAVAITLQGAKPSPREQAKAT